MTTPTNPQYPPRYPPPPAAVPGQPMPYPPRPPSTAKSFWSTTAGVVTGIVLGVVLLGVLCLGGCVALIGIGSTSSADAEVEITSCDIKSSGFLPSATIGYTLTNTGKREKTFFLDFEVVDSSGSRVGDDTEIVSDVAPSATVKGEAFAMIDADGDECRLVKVR